MKKAIIFIIFLAVFVSAEQEEDVPFLLLFDNIGYNFLGSFAHNYGMNYAVGSFATYGMVVSGVDWKWNRVAYNNSGVAIAGIPSGIIGFAAPFAAPVAFYYYGKNQNDKKMQIAGLAVAQAALLGFTVSSGIKAFTGRSAPDIMEKAIMGRDNGREEEGDYSDDFKFGFMKRGVFHGWPSSHTATAFAMASALAEVYSDNTAVVIGAYSYAAFIAAGMSVTAHWASDVVAGALIGVAIGKTVGKSFSRHLNDKKAEESRVSFYAMPNGAGIVFRF
ncbi:MAG: phosphatase PAP2 family protein [Fibromonadales bacterium]|nr:phosphatase PAP2 family protein [Fibromonadales bacterium]